MRFLGKLAAAALALALSAGAQAAIITYEYTAIVDRLSEYDAETSSYTTPDASNFRGKRIALGDVIHGSLRYDTSAPKSSAQPEQWPGEASAMYASTPEEWITYRFAGTGLAFQSDPTGYGSTIVGNSTAQPGRISADYFAKYGSAFDNTYLRNADLFFWNADGTAFNDTSLPSQLDAGLFSSISLSGSFLELASSDLLMFNAKLTSFQLAPAEVPEPSVLFLLGLGVAAMSGARRGPRA